MSALILSVNTIREKMVITVVKPDSPKISSPEAFMNTDSQLLPQCSN